MTEPTPAAISSTGEADVTARMKGNPAMNTTKSNSYTMSRDFADNTTRMLAREIAERLQIEPGMMARLVVIAGCELAPDDTSIIQDGEVWVGELQTYSIVNVMRREDPRAWFRRDALEVLLQSITAFTDSRRKPPQKPTLLDGQELYPCVTPGPDDMFRPHGEGEHKFNERGAILTMLSMANAGDLPLSPAEALRRTIEMFGGMHAEHSRLTKWSPLGGNGPSHLA